MKKNKKISPENSQLNEPTSTYNNRKITIFNSFEEQERNSLEEMARLTLTESLTQLRLLINLAYGINESKTIKPPIKHSIHSIKYFD